MPPGRRVPYTPNVNAYHQHYGGGIGPVFKGDIYQDGYGLGGIFGSLFRKVVPILKSTAMTAGKTLLKSGADALGDVISGEKDIMSAIKDRGKEGLKQVGSDVKDVVVNSIRGTKHKCGGGGLRLDAHRRKRKRDIFAQDQIPCRKKKKLSCR